MYISGEKTSGIYVAPNGAVIRPDHGDPEGYVIDSEYPIGNIGVYLNRKVLAEILFEEWRTA